MTLGKNPMSGLMGNFSSVKKPRDQAEGLATGESGGIGGGREDRLEIVEG